MRRGLLGKRRGQRRVGGGAGTAVCGSGLVADPAADLQQEHFLGHAEGSHALLDVDAASDGVGDGC